MGNEVKAAQNTDGACEEARKDADSIRDTFAHKGIEEAYALLKQERLNNGSMTAQEKDTYEKELVNELSDNTGKQNVLPALSLMLLKENKEGLKNPDHTDEYDYRLVYNEAKRMFDKREMEDEYAGPDTDKFKNKVDDVDVVLIGNAADLLKKNDFNGKHIKDMDDLDDLLKENKENAETEGKYQVTRDFNKSIAETFVKNSRLFGVLDEARDMDGKVMAGDVEDFLKHCEKNPSFKALFTEEELKAVENLNKTFEDANNYKDDNQVFVKHRNPLIGHRRFWITEDSIKEAVGGDAGVKAIKDKVAEEKAKTEENKDDDTSEKKDDDKKVEGKKDDKESEKKNNKKDEVVDTETQMINDAVQKAGEGPYQVAARLLHGKGGAEAQKALTQILKQQLIEDTGAKNYAEAITKFEVGHKFFTCDTLEKIREKVAAQDNDTLKEMFGAPANKEVTNEKKVAVEKKDEKKEENTEDEVDYLDFGVYNHIM